MKIFVSGTDTSVGKTIVSSWICLHSGYGYFKPIQTGSVEGTDSQTVASLAGCPVHPESYVYRAPVSPHEAARLENEAIDFKKIKIPESDNLIIEGAGGVLVPIHQWALMVDLVKYMDVPVLLIAKARLGVINHTLLSLEALRVRSIEILGVITTGDPSLSNAEAIAWHGNTKILGHLPYLPEISKQSLRQIPLSHGIKKIIRELS